MKINVRGALVWLVLYRSSRPLVNGYDWGGKDIVIQKKENVLTMRGRVFREWLGQPRVKSKKKYYLLYTP